jgi:Glycosyltransferase sugar-binding region containing DXD motif
MSRVVVQSLWIGGPLSKMERLGISSFLANGHDVHLYCYEKPSGVPEGTTLRDASAILPRSRVFAYGPGFAAGSYAAFSNFFRYKLLLDRGGWWVDTDVVCLRPFDLTDERLWATERADPPLEITVSTSVIKAPADDALMAWAWRRCDAMDTSNIQFGQIGPRLLQAGVDALALHAFMRPHTFFSPIPFYDWATLLDPSHTVVLGSEVYAVHLWNQMWSAHSLDKNGTFPDGCFFERLKRRYLHS